MLFSFFSLIIFQTIILNSFTQGRSLFAASDWLSRSWVLFCRVPAAVVTPEALRRCSCLQERRKEQENWDTTSMDDLSAKGHPALPAQNALKNPKQTWASCRGAKKPEDWRGFTTLGCLSSQLRHCDQLSGATATSLQAAFSQAPIKPRESACYRTTMLFLWQRRTPAVLYYSSALAARPRCQTRRGRHVGCELYPIKSRCQPENHLHLMGFHQHERWADK